VTVSIEGSSHPVSSREEQENRIAILRMHNEGTMLEVFPEASMEHGLHAPEREPGEKRTLFITYRKTSSRENQRQAIRDYLQSPSPRASLLIRFPAPPV